ncbi:hypothetical protein, partial [Klebsiella pneumoniae]|uniref:hypothetical protein n=1 Tax=Klebsiella pneumoniae TaxID=573 RepID=UPI0030136A3B
MALAVVVGILDAEVIIGKTVAVKGKIVCGKVAANEAKVRLFRLSSDDPKEKLDERTVGPSGMFEINGSTHGRTSNETELVP